MRVRRVGARRVGAGVRRVGVAVIVRLANLSMKAMGMV